MMNDVTARALLNVARHHLTPDRGLIVVNTHADFDHAWGNQLFSGSAAEHEAPIVATRACADVFTRADVVSYLDAMRHQHPGMFDDVILTPPTRLFDGAHVIDGGDLSLHLIPTPGHTDDHVAIYIPEIDTLLAGDAAEMPFPMAANGARDLSALRASLERLAGFRAETVFYCHAPETIGPDLVHENRAYFHALEVRSRAAFHRGVRAEDHELTVKMGCDIESVIPDKWLVTDGMRRQHEEQLRVMLTHVTNMKAPPETEHLEGRGDGDESPAT
jgi:glyoxylase-like metal-dependent hydrolase (beta-lactamase superfamily II)